MDSNHQFRKKSMVPAMAATIIFLHVISCLLYPLVTHTGQTEEEDTEQFSVKQG